MGAGFLPYAVLFITMSTVVVLIAYACVNLTPSSLNISSITDDVAGEYRKACFTRKGKLNVDQGNCEKYMDV